MIEISVVIPTRNRAAFLGHCLTSLCEQTVDPSRFEICVVNNRSTDQTPQVVELVANHYTHHHIFMVEENELGLSRARNRGLQATQAALVAYSDDDATMPPHWIEKFLADFSTLGSDIGKVGGDIVPIWAAPRPDWLTEGMLPLLSAASGFGDHPRYVNEGLLEGNSCYLRSALSAAGGFPVALGHKGKSLLSGDHAVDLVMCLAGWKLYYDPTITINHTIHADRLRPAWMRRRYFWQGVSDYAIRAYLKSKGIEAGYAVEVDMPFDRSDWTFINNAGELPTEDKLNRLRSLGFVLASSGFIPVA